MNHVQNVFSIPLTSIIMNCIRIFIISNGIVCVNKMIDNSVLFLNYWNINIDEWNNQNLSWIDNEFSPRRKFRLCVWSRRNPSNQHKYQNIDLLTFWYCLWQLTESNLMHKHEHTNTLTKSVCLMCTQSLCACVLDWIIFEMANTFISKPGYEKALRLAILSTARIFVFNWSMNRWNPFIIILDFAVCMCRCLNSLATIVPVIVTPCAIHVEFNFIVRRIRCHCMRLFRPL